MDMFETRTMLEALEIIPVPRTFLLSTFFKETKEFESEKVDVDVVKGKRRVAVYVNPRGEGNVVERRGYRTYTYEPPYLKPKMVTTAEDAMKRSVGETIYAGQKTPLQRAAEQLGRDLAELDAMITRREELQAAEALFEGKLTIKDSEGNPLQEEIDFMRDPAHVVKLTGARKWDNADAKPFEDVRAWRKLTVKDAGASANIVIMGSRATDVFLANQDVRKVLDIRNFAVGELKMQAAQDLGVTYIGPAEGIDYYSYDEWYFDEATGTEKPVVPENKVLIGSTNAFCRRLYGAIRDVSVLAALSRYPKSWVTEDPSHRWVQLHSAPLVVPHQIDAFVVAEVC